jgi:hypothetical protein
MQPILLAYWVNIVVLVPIAVGTVFRLFPTDQARFEESAGWRVLAGSLWTGILVLSVLGLFQPMRYSPVLLLQIIYKSIWLTVYVAPRLLRGEATKVPWAMAGIFAAIVVIWPILIPWSYLLEFIQ